MELVTAMEELLEKYVPLKILEGSTLTAAMATIPKIVSEELHPAAIPVTFAITDQCQP